MSVYCSGTYVLIFIIIKIGLFWEQTTNHFYLHKHYGHLKNPTSPINWTEQRYSFWVQHIPVPTSDNHAMEDFWRHKVVADWVQFHCSAYRRILCLRSIEWSVLEGGVSAELCGKQTGLWWIHWPRKMWACYVKINLISLLPPSVPKLPIVCRGGTHCRGSIP